jgi:KUP system potassium uptake protein
VPPAAACRSAGCTGSIFLPLEAACLVANLTKIDHGGWLPVATGVGLYGLMTTWSRGRAIVAANRVREEGPLRPFVEQLYAMEPPLPRVRGTGVFLNASADTTPLALRANVEHVHPQDQCDIDFDGATYFLSWSTIRVTDATGMDRWRKRLFVAIWRNSANPVEYLRLPDRRAITIGWEVPL